LSKSEQLRDLIKTFIGDVNEPDVKDERPRTVGTLIEIDGVPVSEVINPKVVND